MCIRDRAFDLPQMMLVVPVVSVIAMLLLGKYSFFVPVCTIVLASAYQILAGSENAVAELQTSARTVSYTHLVAFPNSSVAVKRNVLRTSNLSLTPQESEQLSEYVSNDNYVKKQKEDIEELASLFKGMLGEEKDEDDYVERLKSHFFPMEGLKAVFRIDLVEEKSSLIIDINDSKLNCYRGTVEQADVTAKVKTAVFELSLIHI